MLYLSGIFIAFFLALLLLTKKGKSLADNILAAWLMVIGLHLLAFYLTISGNSFTYPALLGVFMPFPLLHGPFLYLYVATLTERLPRFSWKQALHFLPALCSYIYMIEFFMRPAAEKIDVFRHQGQGYETFIGISGICNMLSGVIYIVISLILLRRHRKSILDEFSYTDKINLVWLQYLIYGLTAIWVFVILAMEKMIFGTAVLLVMFIGYFGIKQVGIFTHSRPEPVAPDVPDDPQPTREDPPTTEEPRKKYSRSGLTEEAAGELHQKLSDYISTEKPFKESELTLDDLASRLDTVPNYLSQIINDKEGKNFYDFINTLRIEEFKRIAGLPENKKFTLLGMAYDCGFNSKSSFNKYFRKITGKSPTEYLAAGN